MTSHKSYLRLAGERIRLHAPGRLKAESAPSRRCNLGGNGSVRPKAQSQPRGGSGERRKEKGSRRREEGWKAGGGGTMEVLRRSYGGPRGVLRSNTGTAGWVQARTSGMSVRIANFSVDSAVISPIVGAIDGPQASGRGCVSRQKRRAVRNPHDRASGGFPTASTKTPTPGYQSPTLPVVNRPGNQPPQGIPRARFPQCHWGGSRALAWLLLTSSLLESPPL